MEWWLGYLAIGAVVGFFAGLLGIGGGTIMVPLLVMLFDAQGLPREHILHLAVGSAMATILLTSISSVRAHSQRGALRWDLAKAMTPGMLLGGLAGSAVAGSTPTWALALLFSIVIFFAAANMLIERKPVPSRPLPRAGVFIFGGFVISGASAFAAMGGAFMTVPFLVYFQVPMLQAIGTAAALGFPIALSSSVGFVASGLAHSGLPPWSLGYVYLPAFAGITVASVLCAPFGAYLAHRLPTRVLRRVFAFLMLSLAIKMMASLW